jgi:hypothetical protein
MPRLAPHVELAAILVGDSEADPLIKPYRGIGRRFVYQAPDYLGSDPTPLAGTFDE